MKTKFFWMLMCLLVVLQTPGWGAPNKSALVIGNGAYQDIPLRNPVNDAQAITAALEKLGFRVTQKTNVTQPEMENAIREFGQALKKEDVALFYFSGHGVQVNGINYLLPIGADIRSEDEVKYKAVDAGMVLDKLEAAGNQLNIVILDACRNNPYKGLRSLSRGLAVMSAPPGALLAYATAPGTTAADGDGENSPYTKHLLAAMNAPGLKIEEVFKKVRVGVMADTANKQVPWEASSLTGDFYFRPQSQETSSVLFFDEFNQSNLTTKWAGGINATIQVQDGVLLAKPGSWLFGGKPEWKNYVVELDVNVLNVKIFEGNGGIIFRASDNGNYGFRILPQANLLVLGKWDNRENKWRDLKVVKQTISFNKWYHLKVKAIDDSIQCYLDDQFVFEVRNSDFSSGYIALQGYEGEVLYDNVKVIKSE